MAFNPRRDVTVSSGAFSVDVDQLCAAHTLITGEETMAIVPARLALDAALGEAEAVSGLVPEASARLASAITGALSSLDFLEGEIESLRWKLQDAALTYANAESGSSLWELVPGSPMGPQLSASGLGMMIVAPGGLACAGASALYHGAQDVSVRAGVPWLPTVLMPGLSVLVGERDLYDTVIDGLLFKYHSDEVSGARFQRDLGRFALDVNSSPAYRGVAAALSGLGVSQDLNSTSTQSASGVAAIAAPFLAYLGLVDFHLGHGVSCGSSCEARTAMPAFATTDSAPSCPRVPSTRAPDPRLRPCPQLPPTPTTQASPPAPTPSNTSRRCTEETPTTAKSRSKNT